ncbi:hypothetical protein CJ739_1536 [Mariniflexile rhizosphaerae]|uniref:T9SS type A sorting domain-containing protein n=1 Tax=Mariniflexile sp. TRM1-10 TaxID=2027857 RepID=UPI000CB23872|nr:T9SS type A sorting domain-containing protein [Mariniflexile sp. TRM1-10]AXP80624.1 hypothetical protein CJ739_1536 [Mariniflexile sp. TRM1-10]PLB20169.1 MAG: hypothetical protein TRG1_1114 [Flavobacteriaceae bacterium FS1-H7996/R]
MRIIKILLILIPFFSLSQVQIGLDIDGVAAEDQFGSFKSVTLSANGDIVAIGAGLNDGNGTDSGHVRVFKNNNNIWTQIGQEISGEVAGDLFGGSISLSLDGTIVAISAILNDGNGTDSGHVRVFKNNNNIWTQIGQEISGKVAGDRFGSSISLSSDGTILAIGTTNNNDNNYSGQTRIFKNINNIWTQIGQDINGEAEFDESSWSISLSSDGNIVAISSQKNDGNGLDSGHVRVFKNNNGAWIQIGQDINGEAELDHSGVNISLSADGTILAIGADLNDDNGKSSGHVRIYKNQFDEWIQLGADINGEAAFDGSGISVSLSADGTIVAIGSFRNDDNGIDSGHVRIYKNQNDNWIQIGADIEGESAGDWFGTCVSLSSDGNTVAIGARFNDGINGQDSGHVRVYDLTTVLSTESFKLDYFSFYPNPVKDLLNINLNNDFELKQINIYNIQSQYLYSTKELKIDTKNLKDGMYFIEVETNKGKSAKKIVVQ